MAKVVSVNISEKKGTLKKPVPEIKLKLRHGIVGDAHAGDWHRQISLLAKSGGRSGDFRAEEGYEWQS